MRLNHILVGDGECNEGSIWESAILANNLKLDNLICLVDNNNSQIRSQIINDLDKKFNAFGWHVIECDGHNHNEINKCFLLIENDTSINKPICVIFNTIKGKGINEMEKDIFSWHHRGVSNEELVVFLKQLDNETTVSNSL